MTTLAQDKPRAFGISEPQSPNELPVVATDIIYEGAAVGDNASGYARPLVAGDSFLGFAREQADNASGAAGAVKVKLWEKGKIEIAVTGATGPGDVGENVYATDDDTFTMTSSGASSIGKIARHVTGTICVVQFEAVQRRSI